MKNIILMREAWEIYGGIEEQVFAFADEFAKNNIFSPILVTNSNKSKLYKNFKDNGYDAYAIPMRGQDGGTLNSAFKAISMIIKDHNVVAIQAHSERESFIARKIKKAFPNIINIFRIHTYIDTAKIPRWKKYLYHQYDRFTSRYVDQYLCISQIAAKEAILLSHINNKKIRVVIDLSKALEPPDTIVQGDGALDANVAIIANINPGKGHDVIIKSIEILKNKGVKLSAKFIGGEYKHARWEAKHGSSYADSLRSQAKLLGVSESIQWSGYTEDIHTAIEGIPIILLPSESEGIPNCILEGMSQAKLIIASDVGGIPEIIDHMETGILHPPNNPEVLANILEEVFTTPKNVWNEIRIAAYNRWKKTYTREVTFSNILSAYQEIGLK
jgi:glycosyltransferase involved in cell wall biosynthesis